MKVLIAEDDTYIREGLAEILTREGFTPLHARDGQEAIEVWTKERPDFVCLDVMMPHKSGYSVCEAIRGDDPDVPIIFISAKTEEIDKVVGFDRGCDDYITKPFGVREVVARIRAVTRRALANQSRNAESTNHLELAPFRMGDLEVHPAELRAVREGEAAIDLSLREVRLLALFHRNAGKALDRWTIFSDVWGVDTIPNSRTLDQTISQLRKRIEKDAKNPQIIRTVHGVGYRWEGE
ncbi:response regulator transcription factor [bacterium]|nr:response regulator transcription factor [bacterium]